MRDSEQLSAAGAGAKKIGLLTCTSVAVANMVGTGVFTSLGFQVGDLPSGFVILLLWALGAGFALCGALSYAELAGAIPRSGGEYHFLGRIYHPALGLMAGVISATLGFAAPVSLAAMAFGTYAAAVFPGIQPMAASLAIVLVVTSAHLITIRSSEIFQNTFTILKMGLIVFLIGAGFMIGPSEPVRFLPMAGDGELVFSGAFAVSLMYVLYSYSGWNASTYIIGEVRNPAVDVPWSLILSSLIVGVFYVLLNAVFLKVAPIDALAGQLNVGSVAAEAIFGEGGGRLMSGLIAAGLVSSLSAMTWAGPRVSSTIGEDIRILRIFSKRTTGGIPWVATLFQFILVVGFVVIGTFESVLVFAQVALITCGTLTVVGVIVLRVREPGLARPFRCWGYPVTPILFAMTGVLTLAYSTWEKPGPALAAFGALLVSAALYSLSGLRRVLTNAMRKGHDRP